MDTRFRLSTNDKYMTAPLFPKYAPLYRMIRADMSSESAAAAYFIHCLQAIAAGRRGLSEYEEMERDNLIRQAAETYAHRA